PRAIRTDHGRVGVTISGSAAAAIDADEDGGAGLEVTHEYVRRLVVVAGHEVVGAAGERHVTPVAADGRLARKGVRSATVGADANEDIGAEQQVAHEDVPAAVGVVGHKV